ncbi:NTP transferase domain-containing protein [Allostella humosa]|nr:NTP transferase domain-containing protein [Stella humosa]
MAVAAGVEHKALIPAGGVPMLVRVVRALEATPGVGRIVVCIEDAAIARQLPEIAAAADAGRLAFLPAAGSPSLSVAAALAELGTPLLVTTADHALLRPEWVTHFLDHLPPGTDVVAAVARADAVMAAAPGTRRTFLRFADGAVSGCNLFCMATPAAKGAVALWREVEIHRKRPLRMVRLLGPMALLRFALGRLTLAAALQRFGRIAHVRAAVVTLPFGEAAVDVDKPDDLTLAETLLRRRG